MCKRAINERKFPLLDLRRHPTITNLETLHIIELYEQIRKTHGDHLLPK